MGPSLAEIAIGAFTNIVAVIAPSEATYGDEVAIEVRVRNLADGPIYISTSGKFDNTIFNLYPDHTPVEAGATYSFSASFSMPNHDVRVHIWSFYWTGTEWYQDDYSYVDIALAAPPVVWQKLTSKTITISPEVVEWQKLASKSITITPEAEIPPEYKLIQETIYPWVYTFEGDAETCIFEFKLTPEQIPLYPWLGERIINSFVSELTKEGSKLLELRVYEDTSPMFWTNYRVEVTATASPIVWMPIIIGVLAILFIIAIYFTIKLVEEVFFKRKALDEETKKTFSRETLTAMILDLAPETPPETLAGMSDQELRDLLNRLLAEVAPPVSLWPLAIIGGLGILGVGAAVTAVALAKPKE